MEAKNAKVLIVVDEPNNLVLMESIVDSMGMETYTASTEIKALEIVEKVNVDVIIVDIMMPEMYGIKLSRILKGKQETKNIPVIFITTLTEMCDYAKTLEQFGIDFIIKPINDLQVRASVRNVLCMKQLSGELKDLFNHRENLSNMIIQNINNLLSVIIGASEFMVEDQKLMQVAKENAHLVKKSAEDIKLMIQNLLSTEKLDTGTFQIPVESNNLWEMIEQKVDLLKAQVEEKQHLFKRQ